MRTLLLPETRVPVLKPPSHTALDMAFGVGAGTTLFDKSRYRSHGAIITATWAAGLHGYCLDFNAANPDYVTIPAAHTQLDFTAEDFSIVCRLNADSTAARFYILNRGKANTDGYGFRVDAGGAIQLFTWQLAAWQWTRTAAGAVVAGNWYTLGMSRNGAAVTLYRNGVVVPVTADVHLNPTSSARNALVGIYEGLATYPFDGKMEFLRIFRGIALAASEHLAWHNALA